MALARASSQPGRGDVAGSSSDYALTGGTGKTTVANVMLGGACEFVARMPSGLDTWLGEGGARLSVGQRQRLSVARVVRRRPPLLILDEQTNHIGTAETRAVLHRCRLAFPRAAILVISHDPEILDPADCLYLLDAGIMRELAPAGPAASRFGP